LSKSAKITHSGSIWGPNLKESKWTFKHCAKISPRSAQAKVSYTPAYFNTMQWTDDWT